MTITPTAQYVVAVVTQKWMEQYEKTTIYPQTKQPICLGR